MCSCGHEHHDEDGQAELAEAKRAVASERGSFLKTMALTAGGAVSLGSAGVALVAPKLAGDT